MKKIQTESKVKGELKGLLKTIDVSVVDEKTGVIETLKLSEFEDMVNKSVVISITSKEVEEKE